MTGIVQILSDTLSTFAACRAGRERLHQQPVTLFPTVRNVDFGLSVEIGRAHV